MEKTTRMTVYSMKHAHALIVISPLWGRLPGAQYIPWIIPCFGSVLFCYGMVIPWLVVDLYESFIHITQGCFTGTGMVAISAQCWWCNPERYELNLLLANHKENQQSKNRVYISCDIRCFCPVYTHVFALYIHRPQKVYERFCLPRIRPLRCDYFN